MRLVKQKDIAEERKCLFKQSANIFEEILEYSDPLDLGLDSTDPNAGSGMDSPQFLIPPVKFDSTPRSRSQSVELPEFGPMGLGLPAMMNLSGHPIHHHQKGSKNRKMSLNSTSAGPPDAVHVMVQPPSPVFGNMGCQVFKGGIQ